MAKDNPFDEEAMTLIMGLGDPSEPGQHGRNKVKSPDKTAFDFIIEIRDMCEEFIQNYDKEDTEKPDKEFEEDTEEEGE